MNETLLSICIPTYNGAERLPATLDNIIAEIPEDNWDRMEILISDNASEDATQKVVEDYLRRYPAMIRYVRNECNRKFNGNVKRLIDEAKGRYIHFFGDDDFYTKDGLARIFSACADNRYDLIFAPNDWLWPDGNVTRRSVSEGSYPEGRELFGWQSFLTGGMVRAWALSCIVVRRNALSSYIMTGAPDWAHLDISLFLSSSDAKVFIMPDMNPCLSIRVGNNQWLASEKSRSIYLNNFRTVLDARRFGLERQNVKRAISAFSKALPLVPESIGSNFADCIRTAVSYLKVGGWLALPVEPCA